MCHPTGWTNNVYLMRYFSNWTFYIINEFMRYFSNWTFYIVKEFKPMLKLSSFQIGNFCRISHRNEKVSCQFCTRWPKCAGEKGQGGEASLYHFARNILLQKLLHKTFQNFTLYFWLSFHPSRKFQIEITFGQAWILKSVKRISSSSMRSLLLRQGSSYDNSAMGQLQDFFSFQKWHIIHQISLEFCVESEYAS